MKAVKTPGQGHAARRGRSLEHAERWSCASTWRTDPQVLAALANLKNLCETHLQGRYRIEVVDLLAHPELARTDQIVALPTLIRKLPHP